MIAHKYKNIYNKEILFEMTNDWFVWGTPTDKYGNFYNIVCSSNKRYKIFGETHPFINIK